MSGMTGYDQTTSYSQYNYVPNLQSPDAALVGGVDPRQLHGGWGMAANQGHAHYTHMQGSPGQHHAHRGYSYYDRNGYYVHQQHGGGAGAAGAGNNFDWHDPSGAAPASMRPDSPTAAAGGIAPPSYPSPAGVSSAGGVTGSSSVNYSCKMAVQPPAHSAAGATPPSPTQQKTNDNPQIYSGGQSQYGACQLNQNSQQPGGGAATPFSNSNPLQPPQGQQSYCGSDGGSATGSSAHVGQPSPGQQQPPPGGPPGPGQNQAPQAPLPSPLYPWMRSQFGKFRFKYF